MGNFCASCCKQSSYEDPTPDAETRRRQQIEAAERRRAEQENRGIGNVDVVKRQQQMAAEREKREAEVDNMNQPSLKWQVN